MSYIKSIAINDNEAGGIDSQGRFWAKVRKGPGCWLWTGGRDTCGYGMFWLDGQTIGAHRASWMLNVGSVTAGLFILHRCDNPPCVRPDHLFEGTQRDNRRDCAEKERTARGQENPSGKLTPNAVREIRSRFARGVSLRILAVEFGVVASTISSIAAKKVWKWLDPEYRPSSTRQPAHRPAETFLRGERAPRAILTAAQVSEIRRRYRSRIVTAPLLAAEYGVVPTTIYSILSRQNWGSV